MTAPLMDKSKLESELDRIVSRIRTNNHAPREIYVKDILALTDSYYLGLIPEKRRVNHDRCTWIENGVCQAHGVKLTDKEIGVIFYENEIIDRITSILTNNGGAE